MLPGPKIGTFLWGSNNAPMPHCQLLHLYSFLVVGLQGMSLKELLCEFHAGTFLFNGRRTVNWVPIRHFQLLCLSFSMQFRQ